MIIQGNITGGTLLAFIQISSQVTSPFQVLGACIPLITGSKPVIERLEKLIKHESKKNGTEIAEFNKDITVRNLTFKYSDQEEAALRDVSFTFQKNNKYVIAGKSGCGKTTLSKALIGYLDDYEGEILYDRIELKELSGESLGQLSVMIHQNAFLFDEDIEQNVVLHNKYEKADVDLAIENSGVDLFLNADKTLKTEVGENGSNLSGGQRQRIAVARALVKNKPLMILDEGTSAVDKQTAKDIEQRLLSKKDLTLITITHSLGQDLLSQYDKIIFMEEGQIVEHGTLEELLEKNGKFSDYLVL
ncbi:MAG: ABC transporter ATP-binding protein/permease [Erysipelotrichales bacterium]|nr:ABC transporter ATP-binding protein/permease [Erysipelotrichales bacterium]